MNKQIVLLISIDTLRQDHVGCYGYHRKTTPFIDSLATEGQIYERAFTPVPVTLPAHASIFTARYPGWNGAGVHNGAWLSTFTWVDWLNDAGVLTAGFVSSIVLDQRITGRFGLKHYDDTIILAGLNRDVLRRRAETTVNACLSWLAQAPGETPIFCFLHLTDVHGTYDVPDPIASQFVQESYTQNPLSVCELYQPDGIPGMYRLDKLPDFPAKQVSSYYLDRYDGCIAYVDRQIQRLVETFLKVAGFRLTCIITADHGEAFGEDGFWCTHSHSVLPNQTQVPFIVWSNQPDSIAGLVDSGNPVSLLDIGPTVLDLFGLVPQPKERIHGWSLFDQGEKWAARRLFSVSCTQILAYNHGHKEGAVIGAPLTSPGSIQVDLEIQRSYLDDHIAPSPDSIAEGILFSSLAASVGTRVKPVSVTYSEGQEEREIAGRLAALGYIESVPSGSGIHDISRYVLPFPALCGHVDVALPRSRIETLAKELQIRPALDLGCGNLKTPGFLGMDRYPLPGVDFVANLNAPLPFPDNSFDLVFASHALEHAQNLIEVMREIYRICCHGAQVCIVAPYFAQGINLANPYHEQSFNEHTPRFWTATPQTLIEPEEYVHPHARTWGLSRSDHSDPGIDFRCLRIEFFYFPEYRHLSPDEQRAARKKYLDVCDQIVYHLVVVKEPMSEAEMQDLAKRIEYYEPPYVAVRRANERRELAETALARAQAALATCQAELQQGREAHRTEIQQQREAHQAELQQERKAHQTELQQARGASLAETERIKSKAQALATELDFYRHRRIIRWVHRFRDTSDARNDISPAFLQLRDDSLIFIPKLGAYRLQPSENLRQVPFLYYPLDLHRPNLKGVLLAPILDLPLKNGVFGIEIVSPANQIVTQCTLPVSQINESVPTQFDFSPIPDSDQGRFWLRVFVRNVEASVRIFEWRKYRLLGLRKPQTRAFCGFVFKDTPETLNR